VSHRVQVVKGKKNARSAMVKRCSLEEVTLKSET